MLKSDKISNTSNYKREDVTLNGQKICEDNFEDFVMLGFYRWPPIMMVAMVLMVMM